MVDKTAVEKDYSWAAKTADLTVDLKAGLTADLTVETLAAMMAVSTGPMKAA